MPTISVSAAGAVGLQAHDECRDVVAAAAAHALLDDVVGQGSQVVRGLRLGGPGLLKCWQMEGSKQGTSMIELLAG